MPTIIDYPAVLERLTRQGFACNYPNSGAFGFPPAAELKIRGWIGPADSTIRSTMLAMTKSFPPPYETNLCAAAASAWENVLPGPAWVMPMSHWHFEFHDGSRDWLPALLTDIQVDPKKLENRADGSAIEFNLVELPHFIWMVEGLIRGLRASDFMLAFPDRPVLCTVHHHKQLWWTTTDVDILRRITECEFAA